MRSTTTGRPLPPAPTTTSTPALAVRLRAFAASLLRDWRQARAERAGRIALARLDAATLRDLGLDANAHDGADIWPASGHRTSRHLSRYL